MLYSTPPVTATARVLLWQKAVRSTALHAQTRGNSKGNCVRLSSKCYRPLAKVCAQNSGVRWFQSPSLGPSGMREANKMADIINSPSSILRLKHYYINASTVIPPQFAYYINIHTGIPSNP